MKKNFLLLCAAILLLSACTPKAAPGQSVLRAWIDAPLAGSTIPLAPYQIVVHSSDPVEIRSLEISIDGVVLDVLENPDPASLLLTASLAWTPPAPGAYQIQARGMNSEGDWSPTARAQVIVDDSFTPPALELIPSATPDQLFVSCEAQVTALVNTTCRSGPSTYHEPAAYLLEGQMAPFLGSNQDQSWWAVLPDSQGEQCWVSGQTVQTSCLPGEIETLESPPYITRVFPEYGEFYWGDHSRRSVAIQAQCGGESPVTQVMLIYRAAGISEWYTTAMSPASPDIWRAQINAHDINGYSEISSAQIEYYLEAKNEVGLWTRSPLFNNLMLKEVP